MRKKAQVDPMHLIILFIILAIVAAIVIFAFNTYFGKQTGIVEKQISGFETDHDSDGIPDTVDMCPCDTSKNNNPDTCDKSRTCLG